MKKLIALCLLLSLLFTSTIYMTSCGGGDVTPPAGGGGGEIPEKPAPSVFTPEYKDYDRGTVDFSALTYTRPDIAGIISACEEITSAITENTLDYDGIKEKIIELDAIVGEMFSMRAMAEIYSSRDSSVAFWQEESKYIETSSPAYTKAVRDMMVAAARSADAARYEEDIFGEGFVEEYKAGNDYTDAVVALLTREAELEAVYSGYSTENVVIKDETGGAEGTVAELLAEAKKTLGEGSIAYERKATYYMVLYETRVMELSAELFVELVKVRREIADEMGLSSYTELAYREMGYEYSPEDTVNMLSAIKDTVLPVYAVLDTQAFRPTMQETLPEKMDRVTLINTIYEAYKGAEAELTDIYCYMLQHGLYDVEGKSANRFEGAFTTYLDKNCSPFIFMSAAGNVEDLLTLAHEFGHFADNFINFGSSASLDTSEVSSQGLEYLTLLLLSDKLGEAQGRYLEYFALSSAMETLLYQGFYAAFEHLVYEIPADSINRASITEAVKNASLMIFGFEDYNRIEYAMVPHIILYPHYVQSYCTSVIPALELFFLEVDCEEGFDTYLDLIEREEELSFTELLAEVGLASPFAEDALRNIADKMHYYVLGSHYFKGSDDDFCNAA